MNYGLRVAAMLAFSGLLFGCANVQPTGGNAQSNYNAAIADSAIASPGKVMPLKPLPQSDTVTVVSWVVSQRVPCESGAVPCPMKVGNDPMWVTLAGEVQGTCQAWKLGGDALRRRMEQLLGLPMDPPAPYRKAMFVEIQVARSRIQRPCLGLDETTPARPVCTIDAQPGTPQELRNFVGQQMAGSYVVDNPRGPGYPFTRLGYTYDWGADARMNHYGASEFLVAPGTEMKAVKVISTDLYCNAP